MCRETIWPPNCSSLSLIVSVCQAHPGTVTSLSRYILYTNPFYFSTIIFRYSDNHTNFSSEIKYFCHLKPHIIGYNLCLIWFHCIVLNTSGERRHVKNCIKMWKLFLSSRNCKSLLTLTLVSNINCLDILTVFLCHYGWYNATNLCCWQTHIIIIHLVTHMIPGIGGNTFGVFPTSFHCDRQVLRTRCTWRLVFELNLTYPNFDSSIKYRPISFYPLWVFPLCYRKCEWTMDI